MKSIIRILQVFVFLKLFASGFRFLQHGKTSKGVVPQQQQRKTEFKHGDIDIDNFHPERFRSVIDQAKKHAAIVCVGLGVLVNGGCPPASIADDSKSGVLSEVWGIVNENFFDPTYNKNDWSKIKEDYFGRVEQGANEQELTKKMLSLLNDKYSRLLDQHTYEGLWKYDAIGVGLLFQSDNGKRMYVAAPPITGSSAQKAGIKKGDIIMTVNGVSTEKLTAIQLLDMMSNSEADIVELEYSNESGQNPATISLARSKQKAINPVSSYAQKLPNGKVAGYVQLREFNSEAISGLRAALDDMNKENTDELLLDLRGNTGGGFQFALNIGGMFMDKTKVMVTAEGKNKAESNTFTTSYPDGVIYKKPVVIYTDGLSASASEVLVSGLRDNCRAVTTGERTFGKGKIQAVFGLSDGEGLTLTVAQYKTPKGTIIQGKGIEPDIKDSLPANPYVNAIIGPSRITRPNLENIKFDAAADLLRTCQPFN